MAKMGVVVSWFIDTENLGVVTLFCSSFGQTLLLVTFKDTHCISAILMKRSTLKDDKSYVQNILIDDTNNH